MTPTSVPPVDLVVIIDSSTSMQPNAVSLSQAVSAAIESAKSRCPSDLKVTYLGIEGTFRDTLFDTTIREHLEAVGVAESQMRGRKLDTVERAGAQEDGARAIEDVSRHHDWRPDAKRAIFLLGDEALEGGDAFDAEDVSAADQAIDVATDARVRVHTYLAKSGADEQSRQANEHEYARVATATDGRFFTSDDIKTGFQAVLEQVICASKLEITVPVVPTPVIPDELPPIFPEEDRVVPRPDDVSGQWMIIHQVTGDYIVTDAETISADQAIQTWYNIPLKTTPASQGYLWHLEKHDEDEYRIRTERPTTEGNTLYLEAAASTGTVNDAYPRIKKRADNDLQIWKLQPVSGDVDTYAILPKSFKGTALACLYGYDHGNTYIVATPTYGRPTFQHYWRLSKPPAQ
jgi:hypothetical protein